MEKTIKWSAPFTRAYAQRIAHHAPLQAAFFASLEAFHADPTLVSAHPLGAKMAERWSFWINNTHRVIYRETATTMLLLDVGTHEQVYAR